MNTKQCQHAILSDFEKNKLVEILCSLRDNKMRKGSCVIKGSRPGKEPKEHLIVAIMPYFNDDVKSASIINTWLEKNKYPVRYNVAIKESDFETLKESLDLMPLNHIKIINNLLFNSFTTEQFVIINNRHEDLQLSKFDSQNNLISQLEQTIKRFEIENKQLESTLTKLRDKADKNLLTISNYGKSLKDMKDKNDIIEKENSILQQQVLSISKELEKSKKQSSESCLSDLKKKNDESLNRLVKEYNDKKIQIETDCNNRLNKIKLEGKSIEESFSIKTSALNKKIGNLEETRDILQTEVQSLLETKETISKECELLSSKKDAVINKGIPKELEHANQKYKEENRTLKSKVAQLLDTNLQLKKDNASSYKDYSKSLNELNTKNQSLHESIAKINKSWELKIEKLKLDLSSHSTANQIHNQITDLNKTITDLKNEIKILNHDKHYWEQEYNQLRIDNTNTNSTNDSAQLSKIKELESKVENLNSIINSLDQVISTLEKDKSFWEQEFMRIEAEFNNHKPELEAQIKVLNQQISDLDNKKNQINEDVASLMKLKEQKILEYQNYIQEGKKWFDLINSCAGNSGSNHKQLSPNENYIEIFKSITGNKENRPKYKISSFEHHQLHEVKNIHSRKTNFILFADSSWLCFDLFMKNAYSTFEDSTDILHLSDVLDIAAKNSHLAFKVIILSANLAPIQHYFSQIKKSIENKIGFVYNNKLISIPENIYWFLQLDSGNYYTATEDMQFQEF